MPNFEQPNQIPEWKGEVRVIDGEKYRLHYTGYTERGYYSHPGPGWDSRFGYLKDKGKQDPSELSDEPFYNWHPYEE